MEGATKRFGFTVSISSCRGTGRASISLSVAALDQGQPEVASDDPGYMVVGEVRSENHSAKSPASSPTI